MGCRAQPGPAAGAHSNGAALKSNAGYEGGSPPSPQISAGPALPAPCSTLCSLSISTLPAGLSNQGDAPPPPNAGSSQLKWVGGGSQLSPELEDATELLHGWGLRGGRTVGAPTEVLQGLRVPDRTHLTTGGGGGGSPGTDAAARKARPGQMRTGRRTTISATNRQPPKENAALRTRAFIGAARLPTRHWSIPGPIDGRYLSPFQPITARASAPSFGPSPGLSRRHL